MLSSLYLKSLLVRSPVEELAKRTRWIIGSRNRLLHPELSEIYLEEPRLPSVLRKLLNRDSCCVDVGCHVGSFLSQIIKLCPDGKHTAIEPSPIKTQWLEKKFPETKIMRIAAGDQNGRALFEDNVRRSALSRLQAGHPSKAAVETYAVDVRRLDDVLDGRTDFIKIDVVGGELAVLHGARKIIETSKPILLFDGGSEHDLNDNGLNRGDLYDFVSEAIGYRVYTLSDFLFDKGPIGFDEFRKCGIFPFRAFHFIGLPGG